MINTTSQNPRWWVGSVSSIAFTISHFSSLIGNTAIFARRWLLRAWCPESKFANTILSVSLLNVWNYKTAIQHTNLADLLAGDHSLWFEVAPAGVGVGVCLPKKHSTATWLPPNFALLARWGLFLRQYSPSKNSLNLRVVTLSGLWRGTSNKP